MSSIDFFEVDSKADLTDKGDSQTNTRYGICLPSGTNSWGTAITSRWFMGECCMSVCFWPVVIISIILSGKLWPKCVIVHVEGTPSRTSFLELKQANRTVIFIRTSLYYLHTCTVHSYVFVYIPLPIIQVFRIWVTIENTGSNHCWPNRSLVR